MLDKKLINAGRIAVAFNLELKELMKLVDDLGAQFAHPPNLCHLTLHISFPEGEPYSWDKSIEIATAFIQKNRFEIFENVGFWQEVRHQFGLGEDDTVTDYQYEAECIIKFFPDSKKEEKIQLYSSILELVFLESSLVNKIDSIRYLYNRGVFLKKEVKGISSYIVSRVLEDNKNNIATFDATQKNAQQNTKQIEKAMPQGGSRPETDKIAATQETCVKVETAIVDGHHCNHKGKIGSQKFVQLVEEAMQAADNGGMFQQTAARKFFKSSDKLKLFKLKRGEKL